MSRFRPIPAPTVVPTRPRFQRAAEVGRVVMRGIGGVPRSTATRALTVRCGGFGSTERLHAGRPQAPSLARTRIECGVAAVPPGSPG
jgi:hypothetical protein